MAKKVAKKKPKKPWPKCTQSNCNRDSVLMKRDMDKKGNITEQHWCVKHYPSFADRPKPKKVAKKRTVKVKRG